MGLIAMFPFERQVEELIVRDRVHGSAELLEKLHLLIEKYPDLAAKDLRKGLKQLRGVDPAMHIIHHFLNTMDAVEDRELKSTVRRYRSNWNNVNDQIAQNLGKKRPLKDATVLTHSRSGTVQNVLKQTGFAINVIQTLSIPGKEGKLQARDLIRIGFSVRLIHDREVKEVMNEVDFCLLGCDQYSSHHFINKVGTSSIIAEAKSHQVPVLVLADSRKKVDHLHSPKFLFETCKISNQVQLITEQGI